MKKAEKRLGEIVLRTSNVDELTKFYCDVIGLERYASFGKNNFLKISDDFEGHPQMLAIFDKSKEFVGPQHIRKDDAIAGAGTLHHFAFALKKTDFDLEKERLLGLELQLQFEEYEQFGWRSIHLYDPDGNSVEFVCYDSTLLDATENARVRNMDSKDKS